MPPTKKDFEHTLQNRILIASKDGLLSVMINSGELHAIVGGYPGPDHRMPLCCQVMRESMREGDAIIQSPPSGQGASLIIEYKLAKPANERKSESKGTLSKIGERKSREHIVLMTVSFLMFIAGLYGTYMQYDKITLLEAIGGEYKVNSLPQKIFEILYGIGGKWLVLGAFVAVTLSMLWIAYDQLKALIKYVTKT